MAPPQVFCATAKNYCMMIAILQEMKIAIASDHAGYELKEKIKQALESLRVEYEDCGTTGSESVDYPDYAKKVADFVQSGARGILCCGTGIGMSIAANKFKGIRAALCSDAYMARMSREHNDANVLVLGARVLKDFDEATGIVKAWLDADFEGGRHQRRLDKIRDFEQ